MGGERIKGLHKGLVALDNGHVEYGANIYCHIHLTVVVLKLLLLLVVNLSQRDTSASGTDTLPADTLEAYCVSNLKPKTLCSRCRACDKCSGESRSRIKHYSTSQQRN